MKKKLIIFICSLFWIFNVSNLTFAYAQPGYTKQFGFGLVLGEPTGITGKYFSDPENAVDMGVAYSFSDYMLIYSDKLWHWPEVFNGKNSDFVKRLSPYMGVGAGIFVGKSALLDVRIPFGISWLPVKPSLELFLEIVPALRIAPSTAFDFGGGIGVRIYL